eukprot:364935-Chlamydomonas_euryale.AAC.13
MQQGLTFSGWLPAGYQMKPQIMTSNGARMEPASRHPQCQQSSDATPWRCSFVETGWAVACRRQGEEADCVARQERGPHLGHRGRRATYKVAKGGQRQASAAAMHLIFNRLAGHVSYQGQFLRAQSTAARLSRYRLCITDSTHVETWPGDCWPGQIILRLHRSEVYGLLFVGSCTVLAVCQWALSAHLADILDVQILSLTEGSAIWHVLVGKPLYSTLGSDLCLLAIAPNATLACRHCAAASLLTANPAVFHCCMQTVSALCTCRPALRRLHRAGLAGWRSSQRSSLVAR